jgi:hypothetical protein
MQKTSARFMIASLVLFYCTSISGLAGQDTVTGKLSVDVADAAENAPIPYAFVLVHSGYGKKDGIAKLSQNHRFEISLDPGVYDVFVAAAGFAPMCKTVEISLGKTTVLKSRLLPDEEHLQQSSDKK